jgi:hypothetical protein
VILVGAWRLCELLVMKFWPRNASASNKSCSDWESVNDYINCEVKQVTRLSTWPEECVGRMVVGEVTAVAKHEVAPVANLYFSNELI